MKHNYIIYRESLGAEKAHEAAFVAPGISKDKEGLTI